MARMNKTRIIKIAAIGKCDWERLSRNEKIASFQLKGSGKNIKIMKIFCKSVSGV
jgi:hypothetical protein